MRTISAGIGQLRALRSLKLGGHSLLSQTKALATSSGASLLGVPFTFLGSGGEPAAAVSDDAFLGTASPPEDLRLSDPGHETEPGVLDILPPGNFGHVLAQEFFHVRWIAVTMILLRMAGVPPHRLSNTALALHVLKPYGLFEPSEEWLSRRSFALAPNSLEGLGHDTLDPYYVSGNGDRRERRPFYICNFAMYLEKEGDPFKYLIAAQANPIMTGIVGRPQGKDRGWRDANGRRPGAGGVSSFAFGGTPGPDSVAELADSENAPTPGRTATLPVELELEHPLALSDVMGTSFAAFALVENLPSSAPDLVRQSGIALVKLLADWQLYPEKLQELLEEHGARFWKWLEPHIPDSQRERLRAFVDKPRETDFRRYLPDLKALSPEFNYWPGPERAAVAEEPEGEPSIADDEAGGPAFHRTRFGDSGLLENTAIPSVLAYTDVERIIAFVNSDTGLRRRRHGILDPAGETLEGTGLEVDWMVPPLFGYHPHDRREGYRRFDGDESEDRRIYPDPNGKDLLFSQFRHNQVFEAKRFPDLLRGLGRACRDAEKPGVVFRQELEVIENDWYGVRGGRTVTVVWVYLGMSKSWYRRLRPEVRTIVRRLSGLSSIPHRFPFGETFETGGMSATQINLLANLSGWIVSCKSNRDIFLDLYSADR